MGIIKLMIGKTYIQTIKRVKYGRKSCFATQRLLTIRAVKKIDTHVDK